MKRAALISVILAFVMAAAFVAAENHGAVDITVFGGSRGEVPFTHKQHQDRLNDCSVCHDYFSQQPDAMKVMKENGELKKKLVMNKLCIKCHKAEKTAGNKSGPTTCSECHVKKKG